MINERSRWCDLCRIVSCFWIVGLCHLDEYLSEPLCLEGSVGEYITSDVLSLFFFVSGFLTWGAETKQRTNINIR